MKKNILAKLSPFHFLMLLIAGIINAIGVTLFIAPVQLYDSGISGTSILLSQLTPDYLSLSFFLILLNIPLLLFGFKRQGRRLDLRHLHGLRLLGGGLAHHRCAAHRRRGSERDQDGFLQICSQHHQGGRRPGDPERTTATTATCPRTSTPCRRAACFGSTTRATPP